MGQALYRKYRSRDWNEVVGQDPIVQTLKNAVASGKISHAYLFSGPHGVGKTSVARLLARNINNLEYKSDETHIDIIEVDAASNTSVEDIRDLREKVAVAPALAKYKIYIIDEVHMLSKSAFNALLKTLEEPPAHVVFILATTDPQKLPDTIISRVQHFSFQPISQELAINRLSSIAAAEKIQADDEALSLITRLGNGSFRDNLSLLDQLAAGGQKITTEQVESLAGLAPADLIDKILLAVDSMEPKTLVSLLNGSIFSGFRPDAIASQLAEAYRMRLLDNSAAARVPLIKQLLTVADSHHPEQLLELILLEACLSTGGTNKNEMESPVALKAKTSIQSISNKPGANPSHETAKTEPPVAGEVWPVVLEKLRGNHNTLYGIARMAHATKANNELLLEFAFPFHLKRMNEAKYQRIITDMVSKVAGRELVIKYALNPSVRANQTSAAQMQPDELDSVVNIFGGGEVLES